MAIQDWLAVLRQEYLQGFIKNGGAGVKFVVPWEYSEHQALLENLRTVWQEEDYAFAAVDAATTKVHMVDKLFNQVARQIPWDDLAYAFLRSTLLESDYLIPAEREGFSLSQIAYLNGLDVGEMRAVINNRLRERISRDYAMTHEFRQAMLKLCQAQLDPQDVGVGLSQAVKEWLRGELKLISPLKSASIFQKIGRHNARDMLSSLSHWLHVSGKSGLVLALDISRFLEEKRPGEPDKSLYYSTALVVDGYELLRQFIDSTDELQQCLIVVFAPPEFLNDEQRGVRKYDALYLRIWDEVRDRHKVNPLASLVRFSRQEEPAILEAVGSYS
jgi:BREX system ATP-binding protein BrxC/D